MQAGVWWVPVVVMQPDQQVGGAPLGGIVGAGVGPFAQGRQDEAFGFSLVLGVYGLMRKYFNRRRRRRRLNFLDL